MMMPDKSLAAAIDIGSNAIRLRISGLDADGRLKLVHYHREPVRLGHDAFTLGLLTDEIMDRAAQAFQTFRAMIDRYPIRIIRATGTSALRNSSNAPQFIEKIRKKTDINIEVISGEEEARLIHTAIRSSVPDLDRMSALLIDIGGGSVEITLSDHGDIVALESFRMGTVRLLELFRNASSERAFSSLLDEYAEAMQQKVREEISGTRIDRCVGTGGNIECMGELGVKLLGNSSARLLSYKDIRKLCKKLLGLSCAERMGQLHLRPDRADVIIPACLVLKSIMKLGRPAKLTIPDTGLADGVLIDLLSEHKTDSNALERQALAWASAMARKFHANLKHAEHVRFLASQIFSQGMKLHKLRKRDGLLLQIAALTHEIGMAIRPAGHHKHAHYLIKASPMIELSTEEKELVAIIVRYQRKRFPDRDHEPFRLLSKSGQERAIPLIAILRLAIALDKERKGNITALRLLPCKKGLQLSAEGKGDLLLEAWAARKQAIWFERVFDTPLRINIGD